MLKTKTTSKFEKDLARVARRGKDLSKLKNIIFDLVSGKVLEKKYRDHKLTVNFRNNRECHIEPDWLLIYVIAGDELTLTRTGTHADLFE